MSDLQIFSHLLQGSSTIAEGDQRYKDEILKLKLEIDALRSQNNLLQQKLLVSISQHHSSQPVEHQESSLPPSQPPASPGYPPEGFIEEGSQIIHYFP